jgi:hypothetical protein
MGTCIAIMAQFEEYAPYDSLTGNILDDVKEYIQIAINLSFERSLATTSFQRSFETNGYRGELTQPELALKKRSDFGWVFETLQAMPQDLVLPCFGDAGKTFLVSVKPPLRNGRSDRRNIWRVLKKPKGP